MPVKSVALGLAVGRQQLGRPERLRRLHPGQRAGREGRAVTGHDVLDGHDGNGAPGLSRGRQGALEEGGVGERSRGVVDGHHPDQPAVDLVGQHPQGLPLRCVPGLAAGDHQHLGVAEMRSQGRAERVLLARAGHDDHPAYVGDRQGRLDRPRDDGPPVQRQQHLVDPGADPGAGSGRQHHDCGVTGLVGHAAAAYRPVFSPP